MTATYIICIIQCQFFSIGYLGFIMITDSIKCKYFPILPARWHCLRCDIRMANECAKSVLDKKTCPICATPLNSIGIANSIKPFWYRIPKFFTYPAKLDSVVYISILSICIAVGVFIPIVNIVVYIGALFGILKYACKCLSHTAKGNLLPPKVLEGAEKEYENIPFKQLAIFVFIIVVISMAFGINVWFGVGIAFFSFLSIPAITMLLAMTKSLLDAINPMKAIHIMAGMGKSYLILYFFLLLMTASSELVEMFASKIISDSILFPFLFFINSYFMVAMFSMMGYAIYQYHEEFGFTGVQEVNLEAEGIDVKASGISQDNFLNEIHILVSEGLLEEAGKRLKKQLKDYPTNIVYHDKYHTLLKLTNNAKGIATHTTEYIKLLLAESKVHKGKLITIYVDCLQLNTDYFYPNAKITLDLAKTAQELFRNNDALSLLTNFAKNYPDSEQIPYAYFIVAQLLVDHKQQEEQAKRILSSILSKYPNHELTTQIKEYLNLIARL